jgi:hypothetical protein
MTTGSFGIVRWGVAVGLGVGLAVGVVSAQAPVDRAAPPAPVTAPPEPTLTTAQQLFYDGNYDDSAAQALALATIDPENLAVFELRTSAVLFQLKHALGEAEDKKKALKACVPCPALIAAFLADTTRGQAVARARLKTDQNDDVALFFLGKIDLNYVWLQLGTLGKRTGWSEYWEARHSLDAVLKRQPAHVRARVARAWIDYIVDTKMTPGFKWILGGGNKRKALTVMGQAAGTEADFFTQAEARFGLWEMQMREKNVPAAVVTARDLARDFPSNREVASFLKNPNAGRIER